MGLIACKSSGGKECEGVVIKRWFRGWRSRTGGCWWCRWWCSRRCPCEGGGEGRGEGRVRRGYGMFSPVCLQKSHLTDHLFRASVFSINLPETFSCTPSRVQMYLYSSCTFSLSAISPSCMRPDMNGTIEGVCDIIIYSSSRIDMVCNLHDVLRGLLRSQFTL